ncbi:MAG TPA: flagellar hook-basal body complex protein [Anaerolineales bacterium]|nr:flagellar hook-basal body complex protein [Anaerolineales bacterium]
MSSSFSQILHVSSSGMLARMLGLDVSSHNLSNIQTNGFKRGRSNFQELLDAHWLEGNRVRATQYFMDQGALRATENPLDLAVKGDGFFAVTLPDGRTAYTRDGQFFLDASRQIVTASGFPLVWSGQVPEDVDDLHVNPDGTVMAQTDGAWQQVGEIQLADTPNPSGMIHFGHNLWLPGEVSGEAQAGQPGQNGLGQILGRALEQSNVNMAEEMVNLMSLQRSFEMSLRTFQQTDQMLSQAIHMRRG